MTTHTMITMTMARPLAGVGRHTERRRRRVLPFARRQGLGAVAAGQFAQSLHPRQDLTGLGRRQREDQPVDPELELALDELGVGPRVEKADRDLWVAPGTGKAYESL